MVTCQLDTRNLMGAIKILQPYSKQTPGEALARAVAFVVKDAKEMTPFVSTGKIDAELEVSTMPVISTRGARKGLPLKSGRKNVSVVEGGLATKIVLARLNPYSNYNMLTDRRYALDRASFSPGEGAAGFWAKVESVAQTMVKARHSSTHFFIQSWNAVLEALAPFVPSGYRGAVMTWAGGGGSVPKELGSAQFTGGGAGQVTCIIENKLGTLTNYPTLMEIRNEAAHRILEPVLQRSINSNYEKAMKEVAKRRLLDRAPQLKALGVTITV